MVYLSCISNLCFAQGGQEDLVKLKNALYLTQSICNRFIQMDVLDYQRCLSDLLSKKNLSPFSELGIYYMGLLGAISARRSSSFGADQLASTYLKRVRKLQKQLHIDELTLCAAVEGDCTTRIAVINQIAKNGTPKNLNEDDYLHPPHIHKFILISPSFSPQISQLIEH